MFKKRYLVSVFLFSFCIFHSAYSMDAKENIKQSMHQNSYASSSDELKVLNELKLKIETNKTKTRVLLFYLAHMLKQNNINGVKITLLSETDLSNRTNDMDNTLEAEITADFNGVSFFKGLDFICEKAKLKYILDRNSIIIGKKETLDKLLIRK